MGPSSSPRTGPARASALLDLVSAAYDLDATDDAWHRAVLDAAQPLLDEGAGVHIFSVRFDDAGGHTLETPLLAGGTAQWREAWREAWWEPVMLQLDTPTLRRMLGFGPVSHTALLWDAVARDVPTFAEHLRDLAGRGWGHSLPTIAQVATDPPPGAPPFYPDSLNVVANTFDGRTVALVANRHAASNRPPPSVERRLWEKVAAHLGSGLRLRGRLSSPSELDADADAVLAPNGKMLHAAGPARERTAREALRGAALALDRARTARTQEDARDALHEWRAMVLGRWTVLDRFDRDGRRFVVARPNEAPHDEGVALSTREQQVARAVAAGHSNKLIAYELGLAESTVATLVARAARKLGASSRIELVRAVRARARTP